MRKTFFVLAAIVFSNSIKAQQDSASLDEVVITANKYPNKTSLTGKVVTIITKDQLEKNGGKDLAQLLTGQTGVYIGGANSNMGKDKSIYLRGASVQYTLITIDGVPVYDASGIGSNFDLRNISVDQIERIEILKGSQSTLYGSDALAGVINIITKKDFTKKIEAKGLLSYGSNHSFKVNAEVGGKSGAVDYSAGHSYFHTKGINETISSIANADKDGYTQNSTRLSLGIRAAKNIRFQPYVRYADIKGDMDQGAFVDELDYMYRQKNLQLGFKNEWKFSKSSLNVLYSFSTIKRLYIDDSVKSQNGFDTYSKGDYEGKEHFADAYITTALNKLLKLTAGADFRASASNQEFISISSWPFHTQYGWDSLKQQQTGLYAALNINTAKGFNVELGNRLNFHSKYGSNDVFNINPSYLVKNTVKLFANFSTAYRTPSLYQLFSEFGNKDLKPETAATTELGVQYFSKDHRFSGRVTGFFRTIKDMMFFYTNPSTFKSQYINQDKQKDHGVELELQYKPGKHISLKGFYSFADGKINTVVNGKDTSYFNLLRRPKNSMGINAGIAINKNLFVSTSFSWFDKRKDAYFDNTTFQTVNVSLSSYALWDVYMEYCFEKLKCKVFADFRNITNSKYNETAGYRTLGFNAYAGLRFSL